MGRALRSGMGLGFVCHPSFLILCEGWHCPLLFGLCLLGVGFWAAKVSPNRAAPTVLSGCCGDAVGYHGAVPNRLLLLGAPRAGGIIPDDIFQSYNPEGPHCLGWAIPAGDLMALFGCEFQEEELEITLGNLVLPLGYSDMPLEGTGDLSPPLVEVQKLALTPSRLLQ